MPPAILPATETARLTTLFDTGLLSRRPGRKVQVLTSLAASLLQRPSAALSLVTTDKQVFRPGVGLPFASTSRDASFCAHAILEPDRPMIVPDARLDSRFADNPLVTGATALRFYAGVPVKAANGLPLGALCILDQVPGHLSDGEVGILTGLARQMEDAITQDCPAMGPRRALLHDLRRTILVGGFGVHWQPIATADTLRRVGYEALIRWTRPDGMAIAPDDFIPVAEASGLVGRIDRFMLQAASAGLAARAGHHHIAVNISAGWFNHERPCLHDVVGGVLAKTGLAPNRLVIEVTERMLIADPARALREMLELRAMGVGMALDDFGTGYSSLSYLEAFPFQTAKLDKSFVRGIGRNTRAEAIVRAVIRLGHDLGMSICAEGVEVQDQLAFLQAEGCDLVQGYFIGRPEAPPNA